LKEGALLVLRDSIINVQKARCFFICVKVHMKCQRSLVTERQTETIISL